MPTETEELTVNVGDGTVSAVFARPADAWASMVVAHGAGSGMEHPFLTGFTDAMNDAGVATWRFNFPYRDRKSVV